MKRLELDHVERLSHGKKSGLNIGSRFVGHYLRSHERAAYKRALKKGYLDITERDRVNLWHIWEKACIATQCDFLVLIKDPENGLGTLYQNNEMIEEVELHEAKRKMKRLASNRSHGRDQV
ncbi:MAG: hypothetical protein ACI9NT_002015 [Bacteroidia bacterium]|jgi:hypothetical protein